MELKKETIVKLRGLIVFAVFAVVAGVNYQKLLGLIGSCVAMASPFLLGGAIAFILNVPMRAIERRTPIRKSKRFRRPISLCLAIALAVGVPAAVIIVVGPELFHTIESLQKTIPLFLEEAQNQAEDLFSRYPDMVAYISSVHIDWEQLGKQVMAFLSSGAGTMLASTLNAAVSIVSGVYEKTLEVARLTERIFSNFLAGQCVEAVILGAMFFVTLTLLRLPYALLIGVLIAFTALIPIFGAFVGCGVGTFLILMVSPVKALIFLVVFQILQQLEGNLIYPHVVGGSVGLPSIWVLVAVTIGGSAMGVVGMLVFIPLCSVLYALLREAVAGRLQRKNQKTRQKGGAAKGKAAQAKT